MKTYKQVKEFFDHEVDGCFWSAEAQLNNFLLKKEEYLGIDQIHHTVSYCPDDREFKTFILVEYTTCEDVKGMMAMINKRNAELLNI